MEMEEEDSTEGVSRQNEEISQSGSTGRIIGLAGSFGVGGSLSKTIPRGMLSCPS